MKDRKTALLMEIARAYYIENRSQAEIARSSGVTRSQISRYLKEVRERGIVQIRIVEPEAQFGDLADALKQRFTRLGEAVIAPAFTADPEKTRDIVGRYAANYLHDVVRPGQRLVIGCGRTLHAMSRALLPRPVADVSVIQAMGNLGHEAHHIDYNEITRAAERPALRARGHAPAGGDQRGEETRGRRHLRPLLRREREGMPDIVFRPHRGDRARRPPQGPPVRRRGLRSGQGRADPRRAARPPHQRPRDGREDGQGAPAIRGEARFIGNGERERNIL
jgi:transcriptional regulator with XRE-family HTH domain